MLTIDQTLSLVIQAIAAAGTLWAVFVALKVSRSAEAIRSREVEERGIIVGGVVVPDSLSLLQALSATTDQLVVVRTTVFERLKAPVNHSREDLAAVMEEAVQQLKKTLFSLQLHASRSIFDHLHFLPEGRGRRAAAAIGQIDRIKLQCESIIELSETWPAGAAAMVEPTLIAIGICARHLAAVAGEDADKNRTIASGLSPALKAASAYKERLTTDEWT